MYFTNYTCPDISFHVNLLAIYNFLPIRIHWNEVKHILCYLRGTINIGIFCSKVSKSIIIGYAYANHLSDSRNGISQTGYWFTLVQLFHIGQWNKP